MLITPNNSYVYVSLGTLGVQVLTLGTGGALSTGSAATILPPLSTSTSPSDLGWQVIRIPCFSLWPRSIPG